MGTNRFSESKKGCILCGQSSTAAAPFSFPIRFFTTFFGWRFSTDSKLVSKRTNTEFFSRRDGCAKLEQQQQSSSLTIVTSSPSPPPSSSKRRGRRGGWNDGEGVIICRVGGAFRQQHFHVGASYRRRKIHAHIPCESINKYQRECNGNDLFEQWKWQRSWRKYWVSAFLDESCGAFENTREMPYVPGRARFQ